MLDFDTLSEAADKLLEVAALGDFRNLTPDKKEIRERLLSEVRNTISSNVGGEMVVFIPYEK